MATATTQTTGLEADVLRADDRRFEAMKKGDWAALDAALADDLIYVHSTARQESKAEHIANLRGGKPHYRGIAPRDRRVRVVGNVGIVNGVSDMHVERDGVQPVTGVGEPLGDGTWIAGRRNDGMSCGKRFFDDLRAKAPGRTGDEPNAHGTTSFRLATPAWRPHRRSEFTRHRTGGVAQRIDGLGFQRPPRGGNHKSNGPGCLA